jgi:8-oxo-dGTP diphosphatase
MPRTPRRVPSCRFLPGGKVELGETTIVAAARELGEECGIGIDAVALHGRAFTVTDAIIPGPSGTHQPAWHYAIAQCFGIVRSPAVVQNAVAGDDADELGWFTVEEIAALEQEQGAGGSASVAARAIKLNELGLLPPDHSES